MVFPLAAWDHTSRRWPEELVPWTRWRLEAAESARLAETLSAADLETIRKDAVLRWIESSRGGIREYWLRYLGVALHRARFSPPHREQVGRSWRARLNHMAGSLASDSTPVTFEELEIYERRLSQEQIKEIYQI